MKERRAEIPTVLALWREADAVPSVSDDPASLRRPPDASEDALPVAAGGGRLVGTIVAAGTAGAATSTACPSSPPSPAAASPCGWSPRPSTA